MSPSRCPLYEARSKVEKVWVMPHIVPVHQSDRDKSPPGGSVVFRVSQQGSALTGVAATSSPTRPAIPSPTRHSQHAISEMQGKESDMQAPAGGACVTFQLAISDALDRWGVHRPNTQR